MNVQNHLLSCTKFDCSSVYLPESIALLDGCISFYNCTFILQTKTLRSPTWFVKALVQSTISKLIEEQRFPLRHVLYLTDKLCFYSWTADPEEPWFRFHYSWVSHSLFYNILKLVYPSQPVRYKHDGNTHNSLHQQGQFDSNV